MILALTTYSLSGVKFEMTIFDRLAPIYDHLSRPVIPDLEKQVGKKIHLRENDRILDVGGGTGRLMRIISKIQPKTRRFVVDRSKNMLKRTSSDDHAIIGSASALPFESYKFDVVFSIDALHHFEKIEKSLEEMIRVLRHEGEIIILELEADNPLTRMVEIGERLLGEDSSFYEREKIIRVFHDKGFEVDIEKINFFQYILHAKR